jgi:protein involved in polysaccharide export with SLBB domain
VVVPPTRTDAQSAALAATGRNITNQQIADAIRGSGLSETQVRERLRQAGYDPALADPFFTAQTAGARGASTTGSASADFAKALTDLGIIAPPSDKEAETPKSEERRNAEDPSGDAGGVFGKDVFNRASTSFDPVAAGPVDPSYRLGVDDQLQLILTGEVEAAYALDIRRDGSVVIPQVGQVTIAGLTLEGARTLLRQRAGESYSGLRSGGTRLDLSISRIRTNAVFVIGEVEEPGAYQVNALATVFHALARAGGPTTRGSFRTIEVRRGGTVVQRIDLYAYLLRGDGSQDIRLEQGDVIYVPLNTRAVALTGAVRRARIFELKDNEGFSELLFFAGGLSTRASLDRVQVDRILPPEQRAPGFDRVRLDIQLNGRVEVASAFPLLDNDVLTVFEIGDLRRNIVSVAGAVFQPGEFEYRAGQTVDSLLARANGLLPFAIRERVLIRRMIPQTGRSELFVVSLDSAGGRDFLLAEFDAVSVLDARRDLAEAPTVTITGAVNDPGEKGYLERETLRDLIDRAGGLGVSAITDRVLLSRLDRRTGTRESFAISLDSAGGGAFRLAEFDQVTVLNVQREFPGRTVVVTGAVREGGEKNHLASESLRDLIDRAGGFVEGAQLVSLSRRKVGATFSDTTSVVYQFFAATDFGPDGRASRTEVEPFDRVDVRMSPGYRGQRFVQVSGEFMNPGQYAITENVDRISTLVRRAGGTLPHAQGESFQLRRGGLPVAVDFAQALRGNRRDDLQLRDGDELVIRADPRTVKVEGAVLRPSLIKYEPGRSVSDYIELAGGPTAKGEAHRAVVDFPSGYSERVRRYLWLIKTQPQVVSGSTITVPTEPESTTNGGEIFSRVFQTVAAVTSLVIAYAAVTR